ncbi:mRNA stability protein like [Verticillium longisporum]|uniref:mRNA stability protein n=1 Tax=Verticillium longisporum TaxID=100787 RepID=A0A8I2ZH20_VERLO|nr:mRNA stability protein like [Verticillium longisporum]KAG7131325.1 mRNA stability protein like [Verticillium longisporum]KAG7144196.1 mRNA stability protein like [Verticillium longisporum]
MDSDTKVTDTKAPTEKEDRLRRMYGKLPTRTDLLHHQLERKYFDSGDFALTAAHKASNIGNIQSGKKHPLVENISRPSAPVPSCSNVDDNASRDNASQTSKSIHASGIGQEM